MQNTTKCGYIACKDQVYGKVQTQLAKVSPESEYDIFCSPAEALKNTLYPAPCEARNACSTKNCCWSGPKDDDSYPACPPNSQLNVHMNLKQKKENYTSPCCWTTGYANLGTTWDVQKPFTL